MLTFTKMKELGDVLIATETSKPEFLVKTFRGLSLVVFSRAHQDFVDEHNVYSWSELKDCYLLEEQ